MLATDKQTLDDLSIFGKHGSDSVFHLYNRMFTTGGTLSMEQMFRYPLSDANSINNRTAIIQFFQHLNKAFPFPGELFDATEQYLSNTDERSKLNAEDHNLTKKLTSLVAVDTEYKTIYSGVVSIIEILQNLSRFLESIQPTIGQNPYLTEFRLLKELMTDESLKEVMKENRKSKIGYAKIVEYDMTLRFRHREKILSLLQHIYRLDVYMSLANVARDRGFVFATALPAKERMMHLQGIYHPLVKNAVANSLMTDRDSNIIFLTGANMAGKSTFMKTLAITLFLSHMGFPVPAKKVEFSVLDGIYTTINLPDNLGMGASHFYAEVLRVKKMAQELKQHKNLLIIFDELFRGTNVKDAYEATIAITAAVAKKSNCTFVMSTHIIEAAEILKQQCSNINFIYLPTKMNGNHPVYPYTLEQGITDDRHGMVIINNEGILEILRNGKKELL